ncbi:MAG: hemerythrin domain-containing protein [Bacteroidota bacterium]
MINDPFKKLMECHEHILQQLRVFEASLSDLEADGLAAFNRQRESLRKTFEFIDTSVNVHTRDEEEGLFPLLDPKLQPRVRRPHFDRTPVQAIQEQHRKGEEKTQRLKFLNSKLQKNPDQSGADIILEEFVKKGRELIDFYREHIRGEDEVVFPLAQQLLTDEEKVKLADIMNANRQSARGKSLVGS